MGVLTLLVISDRPRAALREAVMTKATPANIGSLGMFVAQSGLVLIWQMGCTLWSDHQ